MSESRCRGYFTTQRAEREALVISLGGLQSNFIDSQTHILIILFHLIHILIEKQAQKLNPYMTFLGQIGSQNFSSLIST